MHSCTHTHTSARTPSAWGAAHREISELELALVDINCLSSSVRPPSKEQLSPRTMLWGLAGTYRGCLQRLRESPSPCGSFSSRGRAQGGPGGGQRATWENVKKAGAAPGSALLHTALFPGHGQWPRQVSRPSHRNGGWASLRTWRAPGWCACVLSHSVVSDSSQPASSSVHGVLRARMLEWAACPPPGTSLTQGSSSRLSRLLRGQAWSLSLGLPAKPVGGRKTM